MPQPSQMMVLYPRLPQIDTEKLAETVRAFELNGPQVVTQPFTVEEEAGRRISSGVVTVGRLHVAILIHDEPLNREAMRFTVGASNLTDEYKAPMRMHQSYALLSVVGEAEATERMAALLKVAGGLAQQGGVGIASPETWSAHVPRITELMGRPDFWPPFYEKGIPAILATGFVKVNRGNELWFITKGHQLYGLPDLAYRASGHGEAELIFDLFSNIFHYMMDTGPVIEAGHTMEMAGDGVVMHFAAPPAGADFLRGVLVLSLA